MLKHLASVSLRWRKGRLGKLGITLIAVAIAQLFLAPVMAPFIARCTARRLVLPEWQPAPSGQRVAVVIPVHGGLDRLVGCLDAWRDSTTDSYVYAVDDCDLGEESWRLELIGRAYSNLSVIVKEGRPRGYTDAVAAGFHAAYSDGFRFIVQLNTDSILTPNWLTPLLSVLEHNATIGAIAPLSNSAAWRSVPGAADLNETFGDWSRDPSQESAIPHMTSKLAFLLSDNRLLELPVLGGELVVYRREVFQSAVAIRDMLEPAEYGMERYFGLHAPAINLTLVVLPTVYVHIRQRANSFAAVPTEVQPVQEVDGKLRERYGEAVADAVMAFKSDERLQAMRAKLQRHWTSSLATLLQDYSVLFIFNCMSSKTLFFRRSGWVSVVQEAQGLWQNGIYARVAVPIHLTTEFNAAFPAASAAGIFFGFEGKTAEAVADELIELGMVFDFVVATHSATAVTVLKLVKHWPNTVPAYFVQDIKNSEAESYASLSGGLIYVKTKYLQDQLLSRFKVQARLTPPTVDTAFFKLGGQAYKGPLQLCAAVRVAPVWGNPYETLQILSWATKTFGSDKVNATVFGSTVEAISGYLWEQRDTYVAMPLINVAGALDRAQMRRLLQKCEMFMDFSPQHAFGRSGLEAMACGAVPILPKRGGVTEYAKPKLNAFLIDTSNTNEAQLLLTEIAAGKYKLSAMRKAALATAANYSIPMSSKRTSEVFREFGRKWKAHRVKLIHPQ